MENKNSDLNEMLNGKNIPKLDPNNEVAGGPEEKLIAESNKDGINISLNKSVGAGSGVYQKSSDVVNDGSVINTEAVMENSKEGESSYGSFDNKRYASSTKKSLKFSIILIIGFLFFIVVAASAIYVLKPAGIAIKKESPQDIIQSSLKAMREVRTYNTSGNVNMKFNMDEEKIGNLKYDMNMDIKGKSDMSDVKNPKGEANMKVALEMKTDSGSEDYSVELEGKSFGMKEAYYKLNNFDLGIMGMILGPQISSYKGKWYLFDMEEMKKMPGYNEENGLIYENYNANNIMNIIDKYQIFKFSENMGDEKLGKVDLYHFKTKIDGMAAIYMYMDVMKEMVSNYKGANLKEMEANMVKIKSDIEGNYKDIINEGFRNVESEVWIGKTDRLIYRMTVKGNLNEQYLNKIMNAATNSVGKISSDAEMKSEVAQVRTELEKYYVENNSSYENFKMSNSINLKAENIRSNKNEYVIWADLVAAEDKWCSDSTGRSGYFLSSEIIGPVGIMAQQPIFSEYKCPESLTNEPMGAKKNIDETISPLGNKIKMNIGITADISYSDFNKSVVIEKPEGAVNFFQEMNKGGGLMGGPVGTQNGGGIDSDNDKLGDYMESYYKTDPNNPDTDGDGYLDGEEVQMGYDPTKPGSVKLEPGNWK